MKRARILFVAAMLAASAARMFAQASVTTAALQGTVTDPAGGVVLGAAVKATSAERGTQYQGMTDVQGIYRIPFLPPGTYEVRVEAPGFQTQVLTNVQLTVGEIGVYNISMKVGAVSTEVAVNAEAPLVEVERTQQANTIQGAQVDNFPNITRNFYSPVYTLPGVSSSNAPRAQTYNTGNFASTGFSIGGNNGRSNLITIDGGENDYGSGAPRSSSSPEAVQEFQVNRNGFAAEFGYTAGTALNVVTKSGTNKFHGSAYTFFRSQHTSARNFFDLRATKAFDQVVSPGVTFGGPLLKDKLFIFTSWEETRSDAARFRRYANALAGASPADVALLAAMNASGDANLKRIAGTLISPAAVQMLTSNENAPTARGRVHMWTTRLDYHISAKDSLTGRFGFFYSDTDTTTITNTTSPTTATDLALRDYTTLVTWIRNLRPDLINEVRVQFSPNGSGKTIPHDPTGTELDLTGIANFQHYFASPFNTFQNRYQFEDNLSWIKGQHFLKFGISERPVRYDVVHPIWNTGQWIFTGGQPFLTSLPGGDAGAVSAFASSKGLTVPATLSALEAFSLGLPFSVRYSFGNPEWIDWTKFLGVYAQDSWKISRRLSLDYGIRFDSDAEPKPFSTYNTVSPRVGFAWDPWGDGKTVIRGGGGTFYAPLYYQATYFPNILNDSGKYLNQSFLLGGQAAALWALGVQEGKLPFTTIGADEFHALGFSTGPKSAGRVVYDGAKEYKNTYSIQGNFGITRQLVRDLALDVAYQVYHGVHITLDREINYRQGTCPTGSTVLACVNPGAFGPYYTRIDPTITQFNNYSSVGNLIYHGMTVSLTKRYSAYSMFQINYTFSKTIDDVTDYNSQLAAFLPDNQRNERALSAYDIRHNFVASGVFTSPWKAGRDHNALSRIFADMTLSPIVSIRSGIPFSMLIGVDTNGDTHTNDRPFYASRNTGFGEPFYGVDLRLSKLFYAKRESGLRVEFVVEGTNVLNHTNFLAVNNIMGPSSPYLLGPYNLHGNRNLPSTAPLGFTTADDPRRLQFGVKIAF